MSTMTMRLFRMLALGLLLSVGTTGCLMTSGSSDNNGGGEEERGAGALIGTINGVTGDESVSDAEVTINGQTYTTNEQGWFSVPNIEPGDRVKVTLRASGYVPTQRIVTVRGGRATFLDARMFSTGTTQTVDASSGGSVESDGAGVDLPASVLIDQSGNAFSGSAEVSVTNIDPSTFEARLATPGDFTGVTQSDDVSRIESFGMLNIDVRDSGGESLEIDGSANIRIPVPQGLSAQPPAEVPLWRYDEQQGRWVEEGTATYNESTGTYEAEATGAGYWNADLSFQTACVTGRIVNPEGEPAPGGIEVIAQGLDYIGDARAWTEDNGRFQVDVMASGDDRTVSAEITAQGGGLYLDTPVQVAPTPTELASTGNCEDIGDLELSYPLARMVLGWGESPSDLDSHFTGPSTDANTERFHIYYSNSSNEQAMLDTDDTDSYGPEVVSLLDDEPGTYVYSVKNYSGESEHPIADSGANIQVFFPDTIRSFEVGDAQNMATGDSTVWRVFRFQIDGSGNIGNIQPIMEIVDEDESVFNP